MQFGVIVVTDPQINTPTNAQDRLQYTVPLSLVRSVIICQPRYSAAISYTHLLWSRPAQGALSDDAV